MLPDGAYKPKSDADPSYAENILAGPWLAVRFLKKELTDPALHWFLAEKVTPKLNLNKPKKKQQTPEKTFEDLRELKELSTKELTRWAVNSNSRLVRAINDVVLNLDAWAFLTACPCTGNFEATTSLEEHLTTAAFKTWKTYWKDVGHFLSTAYEGMKTVGNAPEKIILGGGIGEAYHNFPDELRKAALSEIMKHSNMPPGTVQFSAISAEERESAITQAAVDAAAEELAAQRALDVTTIH
jgi:hypothetical protein